MHEDDVQGIHAAPTANSASMSTLEVGTKIYVRSQYLGQWSGGFEVAVVFDDGYRIRRLSDGHTFPDVFPFEDVRLERRHQPLRGVEAS